MGKRFERTEDQSSEILFPRQESLRNIMSEYLDKLEVTHVSYAVPLKTYVIVSDEEFSQNPSEKFPGGTFRARRFDAQEVPSLRYSEVFRDFRIYSHHRPGQ